MRPDIEAIEKFVNDSCESICTCCVNSQVLEPLVEYIRELEKNAAAQEQTIRELLEANRRMVEWKRQEEVD